MGSLLAGVVTVTEGLPFSRQDAPKKRMPTSMFFRTMELETGMSPSNPTDASPPVGRRMLFPTIFDQKLADVAKAI